MNNESTKLSLKGILSSVGIAMVIGAVIFLLFYGCERKGSNQSAIQEQEKTEANQSQLLINQPPPRITWSLERDNLIKRFKLMNDRSVMFYMYLFIEGIAEPIGYYQVNKVSSVNSQLTNTEQIISFSDPKLTTDDFEQFILPSPAEDGSYGTNGDAVFGFTPEEIYLEHNLKYVASTVPLSFRNPPLKLTTIDVATEQQLKTLMNRIK